MVLREDGDQRAVMSGLFRKILKTVWVFINIVVLIALALSAWDMHRNRRAAHFIAWFVAGVFVPITFYEVAQHLENYRMPRLQRHVIRILFMVPIYAVDCWLALRFKDGTIYFDTIRECYEAYVIYNFYTYCTVYLQEFCNPGLEQIIARKPPAKHIWPISVFLEFPRMGEPFLRLCRHGVINYVVMRPLTTSVSLFYFLRTGNLSSDVVYFWLTACVYFGSQRGVRRRADFEPTRGVPVPRAFKQRITGVGDVLPDHLLQGDVPRARAHSTVLQILHCESRRVPVLLARPNLAVHG
jgi:hypothetical protein